MTMDLSHLASLATANSDSASILQDRATSLIHLAFDEAEDMLLSGAPELRIQVVKSLIAGVARTPKDDAANTAAISALEQMRDFTIARLTPPDGTALTVSPDTTDSAAGDVEVDGQPRQPTVAERKVQASIDARASKLAVESSAPSTGTADLPPSTGDSSPRRRKAREAGRSRTGSPRPSDRKLNP